MAQLVQKLSQAGLGAANLVLAGVCGAGEIALQLAFGSNALACAGILACGDMLLPLAPLARNPAASGTRLRLIWEADDPLLCAAALGGLLRCFRTTGLDAQGSVLGPETRASSDVQDSVDAGCDPSPALVRLGRAYLAELVAVALGSTLAASGAGAAVTLARVRSHDQTMPGSV
jgi:hypothetical protein